MSSHDHRPSNGGEDRKKIRTTPVVEENDAEHVVLSIVDGDTVTEGVTGTNEQALQRRRFV